MSQLCYRAIFQDQVSLSIADGLFFVFASNPKDAEQRIKQWMKKLDLRDKQYFTGCTYPQFYDVEIYSMSPEGVLVV